MEKVSKNYLMKEIIKKNIFVVSPSPNTDEWILLKNGSRTPVFLDTSKFNSHPDLLERVNRYIFQMIHAENIHFDRIAGIPYGGLPFSYGLTNMMQVPHILIRKEGQKTYGTAGALLGDYHPGEKILLLEDATVTADTALEFVNRLRKEKLEVKDIITIIDVEKGAKEHLKKEDVNLYSAFTWKGLYEFYKKEKPHSLSQDTVKTIDKFIYE